ncbi:MAG: DRTGG domain-containing protein [Firmicutes bacterium]|nr:DRTGG domain-containing protein [Bacillota bacterium]MDD4336991.1 DRTGG domain-containing protein [Bacillota bacterium]MDD4791491.1 DRTGG domain-containing protein [Bacillota bacterium]
MKLADIRDLLGAEVLVGEDKLSTVEIDMACGSDLISDVLAFCHDNTLLCTGLVTAQIVRTAEIAGLSTIIFVRGKRPEESVIEMGRAAGIPMLATDLPLFETCGLLFRAGVGGIRLCADGSSRSGEI